MPSPKQISVIEIKERTMSVALKQTAFIFSIFSPIRNDEKFVRAFEDLYPINEDLSSTRKRTLR